MQKYIGTKEVQAAPAWRARGVIYLKDGAVPRCTNREDGYKVIYEDGGSEFLPKNIFEKYYRPANNYAERLTIEKDNLDKNVSKCSAFIESDSFEEIVENSTQQLLLRLQKKVMSDYSKILGHRILPCSSEDFTMSFGLAIEALTMGLVLRRKGWKDTQKVVFKQVTTHVEPDIVPKMSSLSDAAKQVIGEGKLGINYLNQCLLYDRVTGIATAWTPCMEDIFECDWTVVNT